MYSIYHALISLGIGLLAVVTGAPYSPPLVLGYALAIGVGIDIDHFLVARLNNGDWRVLRRSLQQPRAIIFDQTALLEKSDVPPKQRLLTHTLLSGALVSLLVPFDVFIAILTAIVLYVHVLADLIADNFPEARFSPS